MSELAPIWFMRDNHTFKQLTGNVAVAMAEIRAELDAGHTSGMLSTRREGAPGPMHFRYQDIAGSLVKAEEWLKNVIGAATLPAAPAPTRQAVLPLMRAAFRTTVCSGGTTSREYTMVFRFPTLTALHDADEEWHAARATPQAPTPAAAEGQAEAEEWMRKAIAGTRTAASLLNEGEFRGGMETACDEIETRMARDGGTLPRQAAVQEAKGKNSGACCPGCLIINGEVRHYRGCKNATPQSAPATTGKES